MDTMREMCKFFNENKAAKFPVIDLGMLGAEVVRVFVLDQLDQLLAQRAVLEPRVLRCFECILRPRCRRRGGD